MFVQKENKVDLLEAMNSGKIVIIKTARGLLQEDCKILGKFFISLILQSAFRRSSIPENKRLPFFVYIDEAADYFTEYMAEVFSQVRKFNIGVIIAHQFLGQLDDVSRKLKESVHQTSIKFVGKSTESDSRAMGAQLGGVHPNAIFNLKVYKRPDGKATSTEYYLYVKNTTSKGVKIRVPIGVMEKQEKISKEGRKYLIEQTRKKYTTPLINRKPQEDHKEDSPAKADTAAEKEQGFKRGKKESIL